jgi:hypothetical protein
MTEKQGKSERGKIPRGRCSRLKLPGATFVQRFVRCGKAQCWCVESMKRGGPGHGPYWYLEYEQDGRRKQRYVGARVQMAAYDRLMRERAAVGEGSGSAPGPVC